MPNEVAIVKALRIRRSFVILLLKLHTHLVYSTRPIYQRHVYSASSIFEHYWPCRFVLIKS